MLLVSRCSLAGFSLSICYPHCIPSSRSLTGKRWRLRTETPPSGVDIVSFLARERQIEAPMGGNLPLAYDPALFPDATKAAERIERAVRAREQIGVFGDYDCDGLTSVAMLTRMLRRRGTEPLVRLPHRVHDGYGLKTEDIEAFAGDGITLLLTADTGGSAHAAIARAAQMHMDVIVLDHHEMLGAPPDAFALLHPSRAPAYPAPGPCAAGVVFHFLHAIEGPLWAGRDEDAALAMIGTVADLVPLRGRNRALVREGLAALERLRDCPLAVLAEHLRSPGRALTSRDVAFRIAPRINAAGRMADPRVGLRALLEGGAAVRELETLNAERQAATMQCLDHAIAHVCPDPSSPPTQPLLSIAHGMFTPGIIGLIAGKLTERFGRPSMAVCFRGEECLASLRSTDGYNIVEGLRSCRDLLTSFGGHRQAAGCTFPRASFDVLTERLGQHVAASCPPDMLVPTLSVDASLELTAISLPLIRALASLEPFGQENTEPQFLINGVTLSRARTVGKEGQHLQALAAGRKVIGFGMGEFSAHTQQPLDLLCRLSIDTWDGWEQPQLQVVDLRVASPT